VESPASARPFTLFPLSGLLHFVFFGFLVFWFFYFIDLFICFIALLAVTEVSHGPEVEKGMAVVCFDSQKMVEKIGPLVRTIGGSEKNNVLAYLVFGI